MQLSTELLYSVRMRRKAPNGSIHAIEGQQTLRVAERQVLDVLYQNQGLTRLEAYKLVYPQVEKLLPRTQRTKIVQFFQRPQIQHEIAKREAKRARQVLEERERVVSEFQRLAYTDITDIVDYKRGYVQITDFDQLSDDQKSCIRDIKITTSRVMIAGAMTPVSRIEIKLHDKIAALNSLARIEGMFIDKVDHRITGAVASTSQEQVLAGLLDAATDEERAVLRGMAERLTGQRLPGTDIDARRADAAPPVEETRAEPPPEDEDENDIVNPFEEGDRDNE